MLNISLPIRALIRRELRGALLRWRTLVLVVLWLFVTSLVVFAMWPDKSVSIQFVAMFSRTMLAWLCALIISGIALTVPALAAVSIATERDEDSYDLLRLSLLTNGALVGGKAIAAVLLGLIFSIGILPVFSVAQFLVGLDNLQLVQLFCMLLLHTVMCALVGIACSTIFRRTIVAIAMSYGLIAFISGAPLLLPLSLLRMFSVGMILGPSVSLSSSGVTSFAQIINGGVSNGGFAIQCILPIFISLVAFAVARRRIGRYSEPPHTNAGRPVDDQTVLHARRTQFPFYLIDPLRRKPVIADGQNPMLVREIRWGLFGRATWMIRVFYATFILFVFPVLGACMGRTEDQLVTVLCLQMALVVFSAPVLSGSGWTKEREFGNMDMIRMTLLRPNEMYTGKAAGAFVGLVPMLLAAVFAFLPAFIFHYGASVTFAKGHVTLLLCAVVATILCLYASLVSRKTSTAIAAGTALCAGSFFGPYAVALLFFPPASFERALINCLSPIVAYATSVTGKPPRLGVAWVFSLAIFAAFATAVWVASVRRLVRRQMRDV